MPPKQKYTDPKLRDEVKEDIKQGDKGGEPGQWSARKAQMMAKEYKKRGGDYNTPKSSKDASAKHLDKWTEEDWQTKDGEGEARKDDGRTKRYLPKKAWEQMSEGEKEETDKKKQKGSKEGKQFVSNTGKAKSARKDAQDEHEEDDDKHQNDDKDDGETEKKTPQRKGRQQKSPATSKSKQQQNGSKSSATSKGRKQPTSKTAKKTEEEENNDQSTNEDDSQSDTSLSSNQKENESPSQGRKRTRQNNHEDTQQGQKKQKTTNSSNSSKTKSDNKTIGSNHDASTPPAKQGSNSRLPKKGQKNVHWKAMPGWVEGEVMEVVEKDKEVDGKNVKASKKEPKVVLKSKSSGKVCVHRADNVYFD